MDKVAIRGIEILAAKNQAEMVDFLMNEQAIKYGMMVAINAEKVVLAEENPALKQLIMQAEYKYADGISIVKSIKRKLPQYQAVERIAGADLWLALMEQAAKRNISVFLVGASSEVIAKVRQKLTACGVSIVGWQNGYFDDEQAVIEQIQRSGAQFVSVALGSPKQEVFMYRALAAYPNALYMGVGGSYDVFVGKVKRAPQCWQKWGVEWLYRLLHQPTRWQRQLRLLKYAYYYATKQL